MRLLLTACLSISATLPAFAAEGYVFAAPGVVRFRESSTGTLHVGGGGEHVFGPGIGVGAELGALGSWSNFNPIGIFSLNGSYHFQRNTKLDPFVTGGYSLGFRSGSFSMGNFAAAA